VGGLIAQRLIGASLARAAVAIAPAPLSGVPAYPVTGVGARTGDEQSDPVPVSADHFRQAIANAVSAEESARIFDRYAVGPPPRLLAELGAHGTASHPRATADVNNATRGPLLLISGQEDRIVPDSVTRAAYKLYGDSVAVSNLKQFADRGHSLVVDSGWPAVADYLLSWLAHHGVDPEQPDH
jgi:pimeloyl-ACP methyl ester carboxylesterase